jgi:NADPH:quinone reductase-like Zn-dependent oxidoreductase
MKLRYKITGSILGLVVLALSALAVTISYNSGCTEPAPIAGDAEQMNAVLYRCYGSAEVLKLEKAEKPKPADNEVLVKVHAAGVNPLDWHYMRGSPYLMRLMSGIGAPDDSRMGVDFAGTVEAVGKDVRQFKPGDNVFGGASGAFAEYVTIREDRALALIPDNQFVEQSAGVAIAGITALQALRDKGQLKPGQRVLINGASGGVGTFAVQIAKSMGAEVTGVCSTRNVDMVRSIGADHVFDYKKEDYTKSGQTYDLIIDNVGNHSLLKNRAVLKPNGKLVMLGGSTGNWIGPLTRPIQALLLSPFVDQEFIMILAHLNKEDMEFLAGLMESGKVNTVIDKMYKLQDIRDAISYSEEGHARGKIIVSVE